MDFAFTADQLALRDGVRDALKGLDGVDGPSEQAAVWRRLIQVGLPAALWPAAAGGLGLDELDLVLCLEETGRAVVPVPVVETCLVAPRLLAGPSLEVTGERPVTAVLDGSGLLPWPGFSALALVGDARTGGVRVLPGPLVGPLVEVLPAVDPGRPVGRAAPGAGEQLALAPDRLAAAWRAGVLGTAAQLIGLAAGALELTVGYVAERRQFGVPVGSFQAVKHQLADALLALELARPLVYAAAWSQARGTPEADRDVAAAKARAGDAAGLVARAALQCHGAMGYTREYPLHRRLTRIWALRAAWGPAAQQRAVLARSLGLLPEPAASRRNR